MSPSDTRRARLPWILASVLGVLCVLLAIVLFAVIEPKRGDKASVLDGNERAAVAAARQFVVNQFTYRRASFDADFQRTLDGSTGKLKSDLGGLRTKLLQSMTQGKFDLSGAVQDVALEESSSSRALVLVSATGYQVTAAGQVPTAISRFAITMNKVDKKWLASDLQSVGLV